MGIENKKEGENLEVEHLEYDKNEEDVFGLNKEERDIILSYGQLESRELSMTPEGWEKYIKSETENQVEEKDKKLVERYLMAQRERVGCMKEVFATKVKTRIDYQQIMDNKKVGSEFFLAMKKMLPSSRFIG